MLNRRHFLSLGGVAAGVTVLGAAGPARSGPGSSNVHHAAGHGAAPAGPALAPEVAPFTVPLPIAPVLRPIGVSDQPEGPDYYQLTVQQVRAEVFPGQISQLLSYGTAGLSPTIHARVGRKVVLDIRNSLSLPANVHLHGANVLAIHDGHPIDLIEPNGSRRHEYPNQQRGATLWYHDHTHHSEAEHVYRGLHGFYLLAEEDEAALGLPSGQYDVPIALREADFDDTAALKWDQVNSSTRTTLMANGRVQPYFRVAPRRYRIRLLNATTHKIFTLDLGGAEMLQIASDGGLLPRPVPRTELVLTPAERVEVVIDFARYAGQALVLSDATGAVMRFDVDAPAPAEPDTSRVPDVLRPVDPMPAPTVEREFRLRVDLATGQPLFNGRQFDPDRVDARVRRGATERWTVINEDAFIPHTFHPHLVQFRVLERSGGVLPGEEGLKDTAHVRPGETLVVQATFDSFPGRYPVHCHVLDHVGMMGQFEIVE